MKIYNLLEKMGYRIENENGNTNKYINYFSILSLTMYVIFSLRNYTSEVNNVEEVRNTILIFIINASYMVHLFFELLSYFSRCYKYKNEDDDKIPRCEKIRVCVSMAIIAITSTVAFILFLNDKNMAFQVIGITSLIIPLYETVITVIFRLYEVVLP